MYAPTAGSLGTARSITYKQERSPFKDASLNYVLSAQRQHGNTARSSSSLGTDRVDRTEKVGSKDKNYIHSSSTISSTSPIRAWLESLSHSRDTLPLKHEETPRSIDRKLSGESAAYSFNSFPLPHTRELMNRLNTSPPTVETPKVCSIKQDEEHYKYPAPTIEQTPIKHAEPLPLVPDLTGSTQCSRSNKRRSKHVDSGFDDLLQRLRGDKGITPTRAKQLNVSPRPKSCLLVNKNSAEQRRLSLSPDMYSKLGARVAVPDGTSYSAGRIPATKVKIPACFAGL